MGWKDRALAHAKVVAAKTAEISKELAAEADRTLTESRPGYAGLKADVLEAGREIRTAASDKLVAAGQTETGAAVGKRVRKVAVKLGELPILSAPLDAAKARHGVDELAATFRSHPGDPMVAVHLAEALDAVQHDLKAYRVVRSAVDHAYLLHRQLVVAAAGLGDEGNDPTRIALLRRAYAQARVAVAANPEDARALHALARVYLSQGDPHHGALASAMSCRLSGDALPILTLARCQMALGAEDTARHLALSAAEQGATYGYELLAQLSLSSPGRGVTAAAKRFEEFRSLVTPEGRRDYKGTAVDGAGAWAALKATQKKRAAAAGTKLKEKANGLGT